MTQPTECRPRPAMAIWFALAFVAIMLTPARAQQLIVTVNGEPITALDIAQRTKLIQTASHKTPTRQEVLDELIDEKLKLQVVKRYKLEVTDTEVNNAFSSIATRSRGSIAQFTQALNSAGINVEAFKTRLRADIGWQQLIRGKFRENFQIRERDVMATLQSRQKDDGSSAGFEYTLRPILLIVPRGAPEATLLARQREAEGLRTRFENCESGIRLARGLKDVAIRDPMVRTSEDLSAKLREVLDNTQVGHLTAPDVTQQGFELFAVCAKKQIVGETPGKREVREEMMNERFQSQGKRYLQELRRNAMIEYR